jgi:CDP-diacylglycerol--glycerol-3-phosphate 3-phosphatidyltransferase
MKFNIPNLVTLLRILVIPIFVLVFYLPFKHHHLVSAIIFAAAALTDFLDGYLARKLKQISPLGEFLDPVADKLIVAVSLVLLVQSYPSPWLAIPAVIIVSREIVISALREWMSELGKRQRVAVKGLAKFKTAAQMLAIWLLLAADPLIFSWITWSGYVLIYVAAILTLWTMVLYLRIAAEELRKEDTF